jgi:hypothetical protein
VTKGEPGNPHSASDIRQKFDQLAQPVWGTQLAEKVYQGCMELEAIPDLRAFFGTMNL